MEQIIKETVATIIAIPGNSTSEVIKTTQFKEAVQKISKEFGKLNDEDFCTELSNFKVQLETQETIINQKIKDEQELTNEAREQIAHILIEDIKTYERRIHLIEIITDFRKRHPVNKLKPTI